MTVLRLESHIAAPVHRCFDLSLDVELHQQSVAATRERAVAGVMKGRMALGDSVTWRARHFGITFALTSKITEFDPPRRFVDDMVTGPFRRLHHVHDFRPASTGDATVMTDVFDYLVPLGLLGELVDALVLRRHMRRLLEQRNAFLKQTAEAR